MEELDEAVESSPSLEGESDGEGLLLRRGDGVWLLLLRLSCISLLKGGEGDLLLCLRLDRTSLRGGGEGPALRSCEEDSTSLLERMGGDLWLRER